jgi:hypothetical protein
MAMVLEQIIDVISSAGFSFRGAFHPVADDGVPEGTNTVVLMGNIGSSMWPAFDAGRRDEPDAMDAWTRRMLNDLVSRLGVHDGGVAAVHPSDGPPYYPFQRWAMRAEPVHQSPIGPLIHPEYGLWHAYRGALMFQAVLALPARTEVPSPCETCEDKPCLNTCPVGAFTEGAYDATACANHLTTNEGDTCLAQSCLARGACPVGQGYAYNEAQSRFHMDIFRDKYAT